MGQKCTKPIKASAPPKRVTDNPRVTTKPKTARVVHCEDNVLKPKGIEVSSETTTSKDTNKKQENYC